MKNKKIISKYHCYFGSWFLNIVEGLLSGIVGGLVIYFLISVEGYNNIKGRVILVGLLLAIISILGRVFLWRAYLKYEENLKLPSFRDFLKEEFK